MEETRADVTWSPTWLKISFRAVMYAKQVLEKDAYFNDDLNIIGSFVVSIKHEEAEVQILLCSPSTGKRFFFSSSHQSFESDMLVNDEVMSKKTNSLAV